MKILMISFSNFLSFFSLYVFFNCNFFHNYMFDVYEYFSTTFYRDFFFHHCTDIDIISNFTKQDWEIFKFKNYIIDKESYNTNNDRCINIKLKSLSDIFFVINTYYRNGRKI